MKLKMSILICIKEILYARLSSNNFGKFMKKELAKNFFVLSLIVLVTWILWHKILNQAFLGEGYYYYSLGQHFIVKTKHGLTIDRPGKLDNFARLMFDVLVPVFKDNLQAFFLLQIITAVIMYFTLYLVLSKITKKSFFSFSATIFFMANYVASFQMMGYGNYQWFVQRIPMLPLVFFSFYLLVKYLRLKRSRYLLFSFFVYFISVFFAHFSIFLLPIFVFYPFVRLVVTSFRKREMKFSELLRAVLITTLFTLISLALIQKDGQNPHTNPIAFLFTEPNVVENTLYQIPALAIPHDLIRFIARNSPWGIIKNPFIPIIKLLLIPIILVYFYAGIKLAKKSRSFFILYLTSALSVLATMYFYIYVDGKDRPLVNFDQGRHLFVPSMFGAICFAILLYVLIKRKVVYKIIVSILLLITVIYNGHLISKHIDSIQYQSEAFKAYIGAIKSYSSEFTDKTIVATPSYLQWPNLMLDALYAPEGMRFYSGLRPLEKIPVEDRKDVFVFDYAYQKSESGEFDATRGKLLDLTQRYREGDNSFINDK